MWFLMSYYGHSHWEAHLTGELFEYTILNSTVEMLLEGHSEGAILGPGGNVCLTVFHL